MKAGELSDASDEPCRLGDVPLLPFFPMPSRCPWGDPLRGNDADETLLEEGQRRIFRDNTIEECDISAKTECKELAREREL